jgi:hypothetical protein
MTDLPSYFFRVRENGAAVFRVAAEARTRRIEMDEIAAVNLRNGTVRPHGDRRLTDGDRAAIADWLARRQAQLAAREVDDIARTVDQLNLAAGWAAGRATDTQLESVTEALLMAMHDLRSVLVRRKAERIEDADPAAGSAVPHILPTRGDGDD